MTKCEWILVAFADITEATSANTTMIVVVVVVVVFGTVCLSVAVAYEYILLLLFINEEIIVTLPKNVSGYFVYSQKLC